LHVPAFAGIAVAGALGALARYGVALLLRRPTESTGFPWGTFAANVLGCLAIAACGALALREAPLAAFLRLDVMTGFIGAFTTFSTLQLEGVMLWEATPARAIAYVAGSVAAGLLAVWVGAALVGAVV
jgi:CrcB protein